MKGCIQLYIKCIYSKISLDCYWQIVNEDIFKRKVSESIFDLVNCHGIVNIRFLCNHFFTSWDQCKYWNKYLNEQENLNSVWPPLWVNRLFHSPLWRGKLWSTSILIQFVCLVASFTSFEKVVNYNRTDIC